jgi:glutathione S-transferase
MTPPLRIIGSLTSPFVRVVRLVCEELSLAYDVELTTFYAKNTPEQEELIRRHNPLMKVPVLVDGDDTVMDSRVIITYLMNSYGKGKDFAAGFPLSIQQENILTTTYGILDAGVLRFILKNTQPHINIEEGYAARSLERMASALEWLNAQEHIGQTFGVPEALLMCGLDWLKKRSVIDWSGYSNLVAFHQQCSQRASVVNTMIPENA